METNEMIMIPEGWTYFAHRTNTERWQEDPFHMSTITIKKIMSAIPENEVYQEANRPGAMHIQGYALGKGTPFEIRCLIGSLPYIKALDDSNEIKNGMLKEFYYDRRNYGGCGGQRHPSIPPKEELVVLGIGEYDEVYKEPRKIIWTIPKRFIPLYKKELEKGENRIIDLNPPTYDSSAKQM